MSLVDCLATTEALGAVFSDASVLQAMLDFEAALARASAAAGLIPPAAALAITDSARHGGFDAAAIARDARAGATPAIPLVQALRERVARVDRASATFVHFGATSQDVTDTAMALLLARARAPITSDHQRIDRALRQLSERHAGTPMLGRTLLQPATPVTFGLKAAGWAAAIARSWRRLDRAWNAALVLQLGGAAGTLAAFGDKGLEIAAATAKELGLQEAPPWHTDRDRPGALVAAAGLYVATLGKAARDVALLVQAEVGEAAEPGGGSSTMPHKRNPSGCTIVLAGAARMPSLVAAYLSAMAQEHERGVGGIQAEWPIVAAVVQTTGAAAAALAGVAEGLIVNPARMLANMEATGGTIYAERAVLLLAPSLGRETAGQIVADAIEQCRLGSDTFAAALAADPRAASLPPETLGDIDRPAQYLGAAEQIRKRLLADPEE